MLHSHQYLNDNHHHHHHHCPSLLWEYRPLIKSLHFPPTHSCVYLVSEHFRYFPSPSSSGPSLFSNSLKVPMSGPVLILMVSGFFTVWPIHHQFLDMICRLIGSCPILSQTSSFLVLLCHLIWMSMHKTKQNKKKALKWQEYKKKWHVTKGCHWQIIHVRNHR